MHSRRDFLAGLGAAALVASGKLPAQAPASGPRRLDLHHHFGTPDWVRMTATRKSQGYQTWQPYTPAKALEDMDRGGVAASMLSITTPGIWFGDKDETRRMARELNEYGAKMVADYKGRFGLFAVLPLPDVEASLREIEYAFDTLKADGVGLLSSYGNRWHGDPEFAPVFAELNRRRAVVYTHAAAPPCCQNLQPGINETTIEYNTDTSRTIISLIESGRANACPDIQFIFSHAGGTIPSLAGRFLGQAASAESLAKPAPPNSRLYHLRRFYYDTAGSANPVQMVSLKMIVPTTQIVFGTDFPFGNSAGIARGLQNCGFTADELRGIDRENALRILPKFRT
ncbi:MAG TPA: amidohydrolase family protein [Bryobacteraceae bacterium]|nr:amidohydrolase family protein [Bryobacteraceae bacterium]